MRFQFAPYERADEYAGWMPPERTGCAVILISFPHQCGLVGILLGMVVLQTIRSGLAAV